jgi:hypothetical protein
MLCRGRLRWLILAAILLQLLVLLLRTLLQSPIGPSANGPQEPTEKSSSPPQHASSEQEHTSAVVPAAVQQPAASKMAIPSTLPAGGKTNADGARTCTAENFMRETELRGEEYSHTDDISAPETCCGRCMSDDECVAFTHNAAEQTCHFKTAAVGITTHKCDICNSWVLNKTLLVGSPQPTTTDSTEPGRPASGSNGASHKPSVLQPCAAPIYLM